MKIKILLMNFRKRYLIIVSLFIYNLSSCAQMGNHNKMVGTAAELINYLRNCDTSSILKLLDTSFAHTNKANYRIFLSESILRDCYFFNKVVDKHGTPDLNNIILKKDSAFMVGTNVLILPLINKTDTSLNIKKCFLILAFYPDKYFAFNPRLLRYTISNEELNVVDKNKIEIPNWLREINKRRCIPADSAELQHK